MILFGWVYNRTAGSLLAPVLFLASMNTMDVLGLILPMTDAGNVLLVLFGGFAIFFDRMWRKLPANHPAVYQEPGSPSIQDGQTISVDGSAGTVELK